MAGVASHRPRRRIEPHGFRQHHLHITQTGNVVERRQSTRQLAVDFLMEAAFALGILREQIPCPGERVGHRFITCQKNRDDLIAQRLLGSGAFIRRSGQHQVEQAAAMGTALAVRCDHAIDDRIDSLARPHEGGETRRPHMHQPLRRRQHHQKIVEAHDAVDGAGQFVHFLATLSKIGGEKRLRDHIERKVHHVDRDVTLLAVVPAVALRRRLRGPSVSAYSGMRCR